MANEGWEFKKWNEDFSNVQADMVVYASWWKLVAIPTVTNKVYTGARQVADVFASEDYNVSENTGGVAVGSYLVALTQINTELSKWDDGNGGSDNPVFTNVVATSVWYRIEADNFKPFATNALLKISPHPVTLTSGTKTDFVYDGQPHELSVIIISENGFVTGEGITTSNWATVTTVAEGEVARATRIGVNFTCTWCKE